LEKRKKKRWRRMLTRRFFRRIRSSLADTTYVRGTVWYNDTFIKVEWWWLVLLAIQLLMAYGFLVVTIVLTYRKGTPVLKSSELAILLASNGAILAAVGSADDLESAKKQAKNVNVRLHGGRIEMI
jgi:hypothetical protein